MPRVLTAGETLRLGRGRDQDVVLPACRWISRAQAELTAGNGHAVLRLSPGARGEMWVQPGGRSPHAVTGDVPVLLVPGPTVVRMHTDVSIHAATGQLLDPLGTPVLQVRVGPASASPQAKDLAGGQTHSSPEAVRAEPGYQTLVVLCAHLFRHGDGATLPGAADLARALCSVGIVRSAGTCRNDLTRMADLLGLRGEGAGNVSRYQLARAAVAAGWVTHADVADAGLP